MRPGEARAFLEVHHAAVRGLAAMDYSPEVIDAWAQCPSSTTISRRFDRTQRKNSRLIAELDGRVIGIGSLIATSGELRACYVAPSGEQTGSGIGDRRRDRNERRVEQGAARLHVEFVHNR